MNSIFDIWGSILHESLDNCRKNNIIPTVGSFIDKIERLPKCISLAVWQGLALLANWAFISLLIEANSFKKKGGRDFSFQIFSSFYYQGHPGSIVCIDPAQYKMFLMTP